MTSRLNGVMGACRAAVRARCGAAWCHGEAGNAIVEFTLVAILVLTPLVYLIVAVATVQRGRLAVTDAARDVGRAIGTAESGADADRRGSAALSIALRNEGLGPADVEVRYVAASSSCDASPVLPTLAPGTEFAVCVSRRQRLPAVPTILSGRGITAVGRYVVHVDDFRDTG